VQRIYKSQDFCPVARTLNIVGDRWTMLVLRDLHLGRTRFKDLLESLRGISPNLLAQRLKWLEERGMVERAFYSDHPPRAEYRLTEKGKAFGRVLRAMVEWGNAYEPRQRR
jgi:DNA-binding HxlR family transcriptional regulator